MTRTRRLAVPAVLAILAAFLLGACTKTMDAGKVEKSAKSFLKGPLGDEKVDSVKCPSGVEAKEGKNFECSFKADQGTTGKLNVEITSTDGDATITLKSVKRTTEFVQNMITDDFKSTYPDQADLLKSVECPADIPDKADATFTCTLTNDQGQAGDLTVTVTDSAGFKYDFAEVLGS